MRQRLLPALATMATIVAGSLSLGQDGKPDPRGQDPAKNATPAAPRPAAKPDDVATIDGIVAALYASISGPVGQARDFDRMRSLFADGARMLPTQERGAANVTVALSVEDYVKRSGELLVKLGFREVEIARRLDSFAGIAQVWSTYESYRGEEKAPFARGINSIQLSFDGKRWWVQNILWFGESEQHKIDARDLPKGK